MNGRPMQSLSISGLMTLNLHALNNEGAEHWDVSPEEFRNYVAVEIQRWRGVIEAANIKLE